jgi:hypothetical protein
MRSFGCTKRKSAREFRVSEKPWSDGIKLLINYGFLIIIEKEREVESLFMEMKPFTKKGGKVCGPSG